jgi:UDPglucose 6-dehydrogenase
MKISVVGLGKLGAPLAAVLASKGHDVIGVDKNQATVNLINQRRSPIIEPGLQELLNKCGDNLKATSDINDAVQNTEVTFIIVPTPSKSDGMFSNEFVLDAVNSIGQALRIKSEYHVVNITSTVMPGSCDGEIAAALQKSSGRIVGKEIGLCYNPEFIALGSVIKNMLYPDMILVGESDAYAGGILQSIYESSCNNTPQVMRMNLVNAEITKISVNTFVTTKITYANMLADICDRIPGADVTVVTKAIGLDSRIGNKYLSGGLSYGGPCFPRDNIAFSKLAKKLNANAALAESTDLYNRYWNHAVSEKIKRIAGGKKNIAFIGLSYKYGTPVIEESPVINMMKIFLEERDNRIAVSVWDPDTYIYVRPIFGDKIKYHSNLNEAVESSDLIVVGVNSKNISENIIRCCDNVDKMVEIFDCWNQFENMVNHPRFVVHRIGKM